ncbi:MAG: hypothetical protein WBA51_13460 [Erythrobacter sp.]
MVWIVPFPAGPYGDYEGPSDGRRSNGWWQRLEDHFANTMSEEGEGPYGATPYWACVHKKFQSHSDGRVPDRPEVALPPIQPHEPPTFFKYESGHKSPACIISFPGKVLGCSESFKTLVEQFEPGKHRFFPIEVRNRRGPIYAEPHYVMVIDQRLDSASAAVNTEGLHLWMDLAQPQNPVFLSDELVSQVKTGGLKMPRLSKRMAN